MTSHLGLISQLWRYPVKSMGGERLESAQVDERGVLGDRAFVVYDSAGKLASTKATKQVRHIARLLEFVATTVDGRVMIRFPDGRSFDALDPAVNDALGSVCGTRLRVVAAENAGFRDVAALHVLTESSVLALGLHLPDHSLDASRFRPNFVIAGAVDAPPDAEWIGRIIGIGPDLRIRIIQRTFRCITIALATAEFPREPAILRVLANQGEGRLGVFAEVTRGGTVHCGDEVRFVDSEAAAVGLEGAETGQPVRETVDDSISTGDAYIPLRSIAERLPLLRVHCERCDLYSLYRTDKLIEKYGGEPQLATMREAVTADCPYHRERAITRGDSCKPVLSDLPGWLEADETVSA